MLRKLSVSIPRNRNVTLINVFALRQTRTVSSNSIETQPKDELCESMATFRSSSPEEGFVWTSRYGQVTVPDMMLDQYVWKNLSKWQNKTAIVCGVTGRSYSYGKLRDYSAAVAYRLRHNFNLQPGDVVAISMANVPEYAIVALGALEAGLTITTINPIYTAGLFTIKIISNVLK